MSAIEPAEAHAKITHPESDLDKALRRKRKARGQRACFPCRRRKVKCDYETPCQSCVGRDHPELCQYQVSSKRERIDSTTDNSPTLASNNRPSALERNWICNKLEEVEQTLQELKNNLKYAATGSEAAQLDGKRLEDEWTKRSISGSVDPVALGLHANNDLTGETVHLGPKSVPALVVALGRGSDEETMRELLSKRVLPLFGLDNESATYPFVDLWGLPLGSKSRIEELCKLLPSSADCLQLFRHYRGTAHVLYPGVVDIDALEADLTRFLIERENVNGSASGSLLTEQDVYGKSLHWVGLLFATLASGCQCSGMPRKERQLTSQVYVCCAYECLRIINYLSHSTLADIQTLLILGNVISNNMNAGVAWSLLGLTIRLAQTLGLHRPCPQTTSPADRNLREEVWWRAVWQDSLLSITYDRASSTPTIEHHRSVPAASDGLSYIACMKRLCKIGLDIVRDRSGFLDPRQELVLIIRRRDELAGMMKQASHHLRDVTACKSMKDQLEHWNLYLHRSYMTSELYRPSLKRQSADQKFGADLHATCIESLAATVDAFLGLQTITSFAKQSWAAVHRSLSSALLLGILKQPSKNDRVRTLLDRLITVLSDLNSSLDPLELSVPIVRSVMALRLLNSQTSEGLGLRHNTGGIWQATSTQNYSTASVMSHESSDPVYLASEILNEESPYVVMDNILWGT